MTLTLQETCDLAAHLDRELDWPVVQVTPPGRALALNYDSRIVEEVIYWEAGKIVDLWTRNGWDLEQVHVEVMQPANIITGDWLYGLFFADGNLSPVTYEPTIVDSYTCDECPPEGDCTADHNVGWALVWTREERS